MLIDLEATRLIDNRSVTQLADFVNSKNRQLRFGSRSRDADFIIEMCATSLKKFNPSVRMVDCETVYQEKDNFIIMGVLHDGNLIKSYDSKAICNQFHIDQTMAIFAHPTKLYSRVSTHKEMMIDIPDKLQYDEIYYDPRIFKDFITDTSTITAYSSVDKNDLNKLMELLHTSTYIVKDTARLNTDDINVLNDLVNQYGAYLTGLRYDDFEQPEKYVISKTWLDRARLNVVKNPFFIFKHVWRCYFRLCKEGYRFNA